MITKEEFHTEYSPVINYLEEMYLIGRLEWNLLEGIPRNVIVIMILPFPGQMKCWMTALRLLRDVR